MFYVLQIIQSASCSMTVMNKKSVHSIIRIIHAINETINELPLPRLTIHRSIYIHLVVRLLSPSIDRHLMGPCQMTYAEIEKVRTSNTNIYVCVPCTSLLHSCLVTMNHDRNHDSTKALSMTEPPEMTPAFPLDSYRHKSPSCQHPLLRSTMTPLHCTYSIHYTIISLTVHRSIYMH